MRVTFLGTGTSLGVPIIACNCEVCTSEYVKDKRLRTSVFVEVDDLNLVIDTGPDFRQQMLREKICRVDAILFTHAHKDHIAGLDDVRAFNYFLKKPIDVYATTEVQRAIKREFYYVFEEKKYPGTPSINLIAIENKAFKISETLIEPIELKHLNLQVFGFKINSFVYITDANYISGNELKKITDCEVLVINALREEKHPSHFTLSEALEIIKIVNPKKAYLTHLSHQIGKHVDLQNKLPSNVWVAFDGLTLEL